MVVLLSIGAEGAYDFQLSAVDDHDVASQVVVECDVVAAVKLEFALQDFFQFF
jgi:hypothetical protein